MSNNLVSQQLSVQSIQMGQLEHISNKLDSSMQMGLMESRIHDPALQQMSMPDMQMGRMGLGQSSTDALSQQMSISSNQVQLSEPMSNNNVLKNFSVPNMQTRHMEPRAYSLIPEKFLPKRQLGDMETMFHSSGSQQPSLLSKRKAPMEPSSNNSMSQKLSMPPKRVAQMEHRPWLLPTPAPNTSGTNRLQAPSKRPASSKAGPQQSPVQKNQTGQMPPFSRARNESDSVRSKLRQSLADALALVSQQNDKTLSSGKNSEGEAASAQAQKHEETQPMVQTPGAAGTVDHMSDEPKESLPTKDDSFTQNHSDGPKTSQETSNTNENAGYSTQTSNHDGQGLQSSVIFRDEDVSFSDSFFVKDDLLQGNGLSWVLEPDAEMAEKKGIETAETQQGQKHISKDIGKLIQDPQFLASEIEAELFKLFGGVNKKYKEKARSLLFNLKDRSNPELREKVMSGEITPGRLCSMTAEELASKELSEWRMAKAEELAQMVVLPDSDVDIRRLVKKTHKGEFQVEVEQDSVTMEVAVGTSSFTQTPPKSEEKEASPRSKSDKMKDKVNAADDKRNLEDKKGSYTLTIPSSEGTDLMQGLMVDDVLKDADFLPPIVSLDEFMESLDSEPPFENLPLDAGKATPSSNNDDSQDVSEAKSPAATAKDLVGSTAEKSDNFEVTNTSPEANGKSVNIHVESETTPSVGVSKGEHVWEGLLQLSISIMASVIGIFKSGDKTSAKEWSGFVEVKGRVRLDAFEKFLQELPMSRSRAVMVVHFVCKEGSTWQIIVKFQQLTLITLDISNKNQTWRSSFSHSRSYSTSTKSPLFLPVLIERFEDINMVISKLLRSTLKSQLRSCIKNGTASGSSQEHLLRAPFLARLYSTKASLQKEDSTIDGNSFKGHDMLAPFTAGWQSSDLNPLVIEKSEGSYVYDINGKKYLDALAGLWCTALGGNEPRLVAAATEQLNKLPFYHSFWNRTTKPSLDLAKELLETFTASKMAKAFFTNSGSEANDTQVKLVWYYNNALGRPNKKKFIARAKSYHGSTLIAASLSGLPALHQKFDLPAPFVLHTDCPHYWRYHLPGETEEEFSTRLANNLENLILKEGPETIAAFIAEPVMGAGGVIPPPATYFDKIQAVVKKYEILFIADEVICAFGRLGTMYGCDKYNIKPDLVSVAKALSSAYMPIGAVMVSPEVSDVIHSQSSKLGSFSHGFTYSGHPVACAVAIEALKIYKERNILDQINRIAPKFQDGVKAFADSPIIGEIRGTGLILGTEFVDNKSPNDPFPPEWGVGAYFGAQCEKDGMLVRVAGDNIMMSPPFIMSPEEVDVLISKYGKALRATEERVKELKSQHRKQ